MKEEGTKQSDPIENTMQQLAARGRTDIAREVVARAWSEMLFPELETRVGTRMCDGLTNAEMDEFEAFAEDDEGGKYAWLNTHIPHHRTIVIEVLGELVDEVVAWFLHTSRADAEASA